MTEDVLISALSAYAGGLQDNGKLASDVLETWKASKLDDPETVKLSEKLEAAFLRRMTRKWITQITVPHRFRH